MSLAKMERRFLTGFCQEARYNINTYINRKGNKMSKQWFVLNTFTGQESKVAASLKDLQKDMAQEFLGKILLPSVTEMISKGKKKIEQTRRLYPGYAFAEIDLYKNFGKGEVDIPLYDKINAIPGMIGFIGGSTPRPLTEDEIGCLREDMEQGKKKQQRVDIEVDDTVKILDGAFANNIGTVAKKNDDAQIATVEFKMFDEDMSAEVPFGSLEKIEDESDG